MTTIEHDPYTGIANTRAESGEALERGRFDITTPIKDGKPEDRTSISDLYRPEPVGLRGAVSTARLRDLAAALIEHADAVDLFRSTYREAEWEVPYPKPVEVFPGFPLTMTTSEEALQLAWPVGVRARDHDGDVWESVPSRSGSTMWRFVNPLTDKPNVNDSARLRNNLPATIIPTSWPTAAADTTTEN